MAHDKATLEAICEMGEGVHEYNRGVLACIGKLQLWHTWRFALVSADSASAAFQRIMRAKHGSDELAMLLDSGAEFAESAALDEANARLVEAWKPIQYLIDAARSALSR